MLSASPRHDMASRFPFAQEIADQVRDDGEGEALDLQNRERLPYSGLGARATADMAEVVRQAHQPCPLCALGPMMSALILRFIDSLRFVESSISHQGEGTKKNRSHRCHANAHAHRRHDMAASLDK